MVPRTVGAVGAIVQTGGTAAVNGISMLNPARWGGAAGVGYGAPAIARRKDSAEISRINEEEKGESRVGESHISVLTVSFHEPGSFT